MKEFCDAHGIGWEGCGKVIVATDERRAAALQSIYERGSANGLRVSGCSPARRSAEYEPHCRALRALLVPQTGIVDYGHVAEKMVGLLQERGARSSPGHA